MDKNKLKEYRNWIVYQIYPKSFADSNGDGVGDLKGIISKLDYLKSLSVDAIWLSPCFPSPGDDNGYDVSDYKDIASEYGTLDDMDTLIKTAHEKGIRIILDLVANHSSAKHEWFQKSRMDKTNDYADYYYWADEPLNDWGSAFGGKSAWIYDDVRKQYYLASFAPTQPDLNWTNPKVREEMQGVVDFWVKRGVDGFRCDVLDMISKDFYSPGGKENGPMLHPYIKELFDRETTKDIFTVGECWSTDIENIKLLCGLERGELCCTFQNEHRAHGYDLADKYFGTEFKLKDVAKTLSKWQKSTIANDILYTLFWENHDSPRVVSRFGDESKRYQSSTMLSTMLCLMCGVIFLFEGQELGLINTNFDKIEDFDDIECKGYYKNHIGDLPEKEILKRINQFGRDNGRRMIPWTDERKPSWIKSDERQFDFNVEAQDKDEDSVLNYFRKMLSLRKENLAFSLGGYEEIAITDEYCIYEREYENEKFTVVCNFEKPSKIEGLCGEVVLSNCKKEHIGADFAPYECVVIKNIK